MKQSHDDIALLSNCKICMYIVFLSDNTLLCSQIVHCAVHTLYVTLFTDCLLIVHCFRLRNDFITDNALLHFEMRHCFVCRLYLAFSYPSCSSVSHHYSMQMIHNQWQTVAASFDYTTKVIQSSENLSKVYAIIQLQ